MSTKFQEFVEDCRLEAMTKVEELAEAQEDAILGYVWAGEYGLRDYRSWATMPLADYFWQLLKTYYVIAAFVFLLSIAFVAATFMEPNPSVRHTAQALFGGMIVVFVGISILDFRIHYRWFKNRGFVFKHHNEIRDNAARMIAIGEKYLYSALTKPNKERFFQPDLIVESDPYADVSRVDIINLPNRKALSVVGTNLGLDILQDPDFGETENLLEEMRLRIEADKTA